MDKIVAFCKRRGFVYQSSEIYGGIRSSYDYGPLGVEMKRNVKEEWWRRMVHVRDDVVGIDAAIIMHPRVWEASGHVAGFNDMLVESRTSGKRYRADHLIEAATGREDIEGLSPEELTKIIQNDERIKDPADGGRDFAPVRPFNLMFETYTGPVKSPENVAYLRPETAQGIFVNFKNVLQTSRVKLPFGIAQQGKSFRNEITPGNFIFRTREFEQMEMEFFVQPGTDAEWFERWRGWRMEWHHSLGLDPSKLQWHEHSGSELAHYAKAAFDIQYQFPFGWQEIEGIHNRGDFDLSRHQEYSGKKLEYFDQAQNQRYLPFIVETSAGADRVTLTLLVDAYREEQVEGETRVVLGLHPAVAPIKAGIFPLVKKDGMPETATTLYHELRQEFACFYDDSGAIGRRYRRMDEAGTPFGVTVDGDTTTARTVTVRHRDTMQQERVGLDRVRQYIVDRLGATR